MSPRDRDLAEVAMASRTDPMVSVIAGLASSNGPTYMVGLLVNGMTIYGRTADPMRMAEAVDAENVRWGERAKSATGREGWDEYSQKVATMWADRLKTAEEEESVLVEHMTVDLDELPEEVARKVIRAREQDLTLADAKVFPQGAAPFEVPLLRIQLAQVSGWWLLPTDAEGRATYSHPGA